MDQQCRPILPHSASRETVPTRSTTRESMSWATPRPRRRRQCALTTLHRRSLPTPPRATTALHRSPSRRPTATPESSRSRRGLMTALGNPPPLLASLKPVTILSSSGHVTMSATRPPTACSSTCTHTSSRPHQTSTTAVRGAPQPMSCSLAAATQRHSDPSPRHTSSSRARASRWSP